MVRSNRRLDKFKIDFTAEEVERDTRFKKVDVEKLVNDTTAC